MFRIIRISLFALALTLASLSVNAETYAVIIGISSYPDMPLLLCENDANSMYKLYSKKTTHIVKLLSSQATCASIIRETKRMYSQAKEDDMVVFYFSGHGYPGGICPYDIGYVDYQIVNGITYEDIAAIMRLCPAKKKIIFADACYSGGLRSAANSPHTSKISDSNVLLFLASRDNETSIEMPLFMDNGLFTAALYRGLTGGADTNRNKVITAKELFIYVNGNVRNINEEQHPVMYGHFDDNFIIFDWR